MNLGSNYAAVAETLSVYFDGLYNSDTAKLRQAFHPLAIYACATEGELLHMGMSDYFAVVDKRPSPASRGEARRDRIVSIEFAGPVTALAKVTCSIGPKDFTDLLSLVYVENKWRIISKVFHFDLRN